MFLLFWLMYVDFSSLFVKFELYKASFDKYLLEFTCKSFVKKNLWKTVFALCMYEKKNSSTWCVKQMVFYWHEEKCYQAWKFQVLFICCVVLVNKIGLSLSRKIGRLFSNMFLYLKKSYKQRGHLCYVQIGLRFMTYEYLSPLLTLRSLFIVSYKSYLLVKRS